MLFLKGLSPHGTTTGAASIPRKLVNVATCKAGWAMIAAAFLLGAHRPSAQKPFVALCKSFRLLLGHGISPLRN
jgi:hypothetical protein